MEIKIGTRGSQLALWQANFIAEELSKKNSALEVELVKIQAGKVDSLKNLNFNF